MRNYDTTEDSMKALLATNEIIDDANSRHPFKATAFGPQFTVFSMFGEAPHKALLSRACDRVLTPSACAAPCTTVRIQDLLYASLAWALAVAFFIMLLSVHVGVALIIACIVVVVDSDLLAAVYYFDNNMAPFTFAAVVISVGASSQHTGWDARDELRPIWLRFTHVASALAKKYWDARRRSLSAGLALDYAIHVAQEFMLSEGTGNERAQAAVSRVGRAVFNGGFTTFLGMAILCMGPGKPF
jgi:hypothetical protein